MFSKLMMMFKGVGDSPEMGRVLWFLGALATIGYQGYAIFKGQNFDPLVFAGGYAALLAAGGFGIRQKDTGVAAAVASSTPTVNVETVTGGITSETTNVGNTTG